MKHDKLEVKTETIFLPKYHFTICNSNNLSANKMNILTRRIITRQTLIIQKGYFVAENASRLREYISNSANPRWKINEPIC